MARKLLIFESIRIGFAKFWIVVDLAGCSLPVTRDSQRNKDDQENGAGQYRVEDRLIHGERISWVISLRQVTEELPERQRCELLDTAEGVARAAPGMALTITSRSAARRS